MKKFFSGIIAAILLCSGTAVFADGVEYNSENNAVSVTNASSYKTVIITKNDDETDSGIVYVNQTGSGTFEESVNFLLKENPADGDYTVLLGGSVSGTPVTFSFSIATEIVVTETEAAASFIEESETAGNKNLAFGWEDVSADQVKTVILKLGEKYYGWEFPTTITGGDINIGVRITDVPESQLTGGAKAYLSSRLLDEIAK